MKKTPELKQIKSDSDAEDYLEVEDEVPVDIVELLTHIMNVLPASDRKSYKSRLSAIDYGPYATNGLSEELVRKRLGEIVQKTLKKLTLSDLLAVAISNPSRYLSDKQRKVPIYQLFLKDFHQRHADLPWKERCILAPNEFRALSVTAKQKYIDAASKINASSVEPPQSPAPVQSNESPKKSIQKAPKASKVTAVKANKQPLPVPSSPTKTIEELPVWPVIKPFEYFVKEQKITNGSYKVEGLKEAYAALKPEQKVQYIYKVMQLVEGNSKKLNLTKADLDVLNAYEKRPTNPGNVFTMFLAEKNSDPWLAQLPYQERIKEIGSLWKQLDADAKEQYEKQFNRIKEDYDKNFEIYLQGLPEFRRKQELEKPRQAARHRAHVQSIEDAQENVIAPEVQEPDVAVAKPKKRKARAKTVDAPTKEIKLEVAETPVVPDVAVPKVTKKRKLPNAVAVNGGMTPKKVAKMERLVEPQKPPNSVKEYFKSLYKGDRKEAGKAFKALTKDEKQVFYEKLKAVSDKYILDFTVFLKSLSKEEMTEYMKRNQEQHA